jgi:hypothetical protein
VVPHLGRRDHGIVVVDGGSGMGGIWKAPLVLNVSLLNVRRCPSGWPRR